MESGAQPPKRYELDCQNLHSCFSGGGTANDQRKIIEIFCGRNMGELGLIRRTYSSLYNCDFVPLLSRKNNIFYRAVHLRCSEPHERDAGIMRGALFGGRVDLHTLAEVTCTRSSYDLKCSKQAYEARYNSSLEHDLSTKVVHSFKEVLLAVLNSSRYDGARVDTSMAMCDAKVLYEAIESGKTVDQKAIISILSQRSTGQLKAILLAYKQLYGHDFMKFLKKEKCGEFGDQLRVVIRCIQYPEKHFAKQLRRVLKDGNAHEVLIRTVITRAEADLKGINAAFSAKTGWSLESLIRSEFNGTSSANRDDNAGAFVADFLVMLLKRY